MRKKVIYILLAVSMVLSASGCSAVTEWIDEQKSRLFPDETVTEEENAADKPNVINAGIYEFDTFNPLITQSQSVREAMELVYEPLYTLDGEMRAVPVLAESAQKSADGRTITVNIKQGVTWHDGAPLTATDVAYTFKMIRSGVTNYTSNLANVADYTMLDDYIIQITLSHGSPKFESMLTFPIVRYQTDMSVNPRYIPNGTGPFCYGSQTSVDEIYFGSFENYHGGRAAIDSMKLHIADTYERYMTMLEASEIDFSSGDIVDLMTYMPKGSLKLHDYPENRMVYLGFNMRNEVLSGSLTRKGIAELIDRENIVDSVIFSRGTASEIPINPASYLYYGGNVNFKADELQANSLLGDDGWGPDMDGRFIRKVNGTEQSITLELLANSDSAEQSNVAEAVAAHMNRFGLVITVTKLPYDEFISRITSGSYDMFIGEINVPANMELTQITSASGNYFAYNNPELDTIMAQMGMAASDEELKELFQQYSEIVLNDMPFSVIYYRKGSLISSANVTSGINPTYTWLYNNCSTWSTGQ